MPLGHNEVYYGYGNYGPGNVNVTKKTTINVTNIYVNSRVTNGVVVVRKDNFLRGKIVHERIAPARNPFEGSGAGGVKIIGRPPVQEIKPIRETRQPRPDAEIKRVSLPPVRLEKESKTIKERVVAPTKEKSVFKPGNKPAPLKNIVKEKELEQWVPPKKAPAAKPATPAKTAPQTAQGPQVRAAVRETTVQEDTGTPTPRRRAYQGKRARGAGRKSDGAHRRGDGTCQGIAL